ncbi:MAG: hypothetical protein Kow0062_03780 [Acidobacteriota bacterium]
MRTGMRFLALAAALGAAAPSPTADPPGDRQAFPVAFERGFPGVALAERDVTVIARRGGVVEEIAVRLGEQVRAGQVLASLRDDEIEQGVRLAEVGLRAAEAAREQAVAELDLAAARLARREEARGMVALEEIESAREQVRIARAALARAEAELERARLALAQARRDRDALRVRTPVDGQVAALWSARGDVLAPGAGVVRIAGSGTRRVRFAVPPSVGRRLAAGVAVRVVLEDGAGPAVPAVVSSVAPEIDEASGMVFAEAEIAPNADPGGDARWGGVLRVFVED